MKEPLQPDQLVRGTLLIASPEIDTSVYFRSVILLCEHTSTGSFGLILNKTLDIEIPEDVINLKDVPNRKVEVRLGGPLQPNQMTLLHSEALSSDQALKVCDGVYLGGDISFLQEALTNPEGPYIRLCFGFCGWGPAQLEKECFSGLWFTSPATSSLVFETSTSDLWRATLKQKGGTYATLAQMPDDLSLN